jgi:sigma-B regulation protein RsbU (phosphoserine phosphatase)
VKLRLSIKKFLRLFFTTLLSILFFLLIYYGLYFLIGISHPSFAVFITIFITLLFNEQITWKIRNFIDKNFYRKIFITNRLLNEYNLKLNSFTDFQTIISGFINFLKHTFPENSWSFYYRWGLDFELFEKNNTKEKLPNLIRIPKQTLQNKIITDDVDFHTLGKLKTKVPELQTVLKRIPDTDKFFYFYPLQSYKDINGFLLFDRQFGYFLYYSEPRNMIKRVLKKTADVLENGMLYSEVERKSLQNFLLLEIGKKISSSLDLNEVLETIIDSIHMLVNYDAAGIFLLDEKENILRRMVTRGYDKKVLDQITLKLDLGIYGWVIQNQQASLINDVTKETKYFEVRKSTKSQLAVPLMNNEKVLGIIAVESDKINHFTPSDKELLLNFASHAVLAIENAQLYEEALQKRRLESELVVASMVQQALLPTRPPEISGINISFCSIPSRIVGGDFLDIFRLSDIKLGITISDVSGKGAPASILMAVLYAGFKSLLMEIYPVVEVVARLNNLLAETTAEGYFATFFFGIYNKNTHELTYTNAGHNPPIIFTKSGKVRRLDIGGPVLGFLKDCEYKQENVRLLSGDYLIIYTDGVTEVTNSKGDEYGDDRLIELLRENYGKSAYEMREILMNDLRKFSSSKEFSDDVTFGIIFIQ